MWIGRRKKLNDSIEVALAYKESAENDMNAANTLLSSGLYNEAAYYFIQSMEKNVKEKLCRTVDVTNPYFSKKLQEIGHSLDKSIEFLIEILSTGNDVLQEQITEQLVKGVLKGVFFSRLYNEVRYPKFNYKYNEYTTLTVSRQDCEVLKEILRNLKVYISALDKHL